MMRILLAVAISALAGACSPAAEDTTGGDGGAPDRARPDTVGETGGETGGGCDEAACDERCRAAGYEGGECARSGACSCAAGGDAGTPGSTGERCDDGIDNNGNGAVDEGCSCALGTTQPCWPGPAVARGLGLCADGLQECSGGGEFAHWGECLGAVLPGAEECNGLDDDCDYAVDEDCPGACTPSEWEAETICDDGIDNDCDTAADCFDPDCPPCCGDEICGDGIDNNCDGATDEYCDDPCAGWEMGPVVCADGIDNDCDTRIDCEDLQCLIFCCSTEVCGDGDDNDCDGRVDCDDTDCCTDPACAGSEVCGYICCVPTEIRWCDTPSYCSWGQQTCRPDGRWGTCEETTARPAGCDDGSYYYDPACCVAAGECCQNFGYDPSLPSEASVGACEEEVAPCS